MRVAVDGPTAAGKTSLGHELAAVLARADREVFRASLDDFKRPWAEAHLYDRVSGEGYYRNAYDLGAARRLLLDPAAPTGDGVVALCSIDPITQVDHSDTTVEVPPGGVVIVDGMFTLRPELAACWEHRIWVDVDADLSIGRGVLRDAGRDGAERAEALHRDRYGPALDVYLREADPIARADVVIDNTRFEEPIILRG